MNGISFRCGRQLETETDCRVTELSGYKDIERMTFLPKAFCTFNVKPPSSPAPSLMSNYELDNVSIRKQILLCVHCHRIPTLCAMYTVYLYTQTYTTNTVVLHVVQILFVLQVFSSQSLVGLGKQYQINYILAVLLILV